MKLAAGTNIYLPLVTRHLSFSRRTWTPPSPPIERISRKLVYERKSRFNKNIIRGVIDSMMLIDTLRENEFTMRFLLFDIFKFLLFNELFKYDWVWCTLHLEEIFCLHPPVRLLFNIKRFSNTTILLNFQV